MRLAKLMRPSLTLLLCVFVWGLLGLAASAWDQFRPLWMMGGAVLLAVTCLDFVMVLLRKVPVVERTLPGRFAVGVVGSVGLRIRNTGLSNLKVDIFDGMPPTAECGQMPWTGEVSGGRFVEINYETSFFKRGPFEFSKCQLLMHSRAGLWRRKIYAGEVAAVKVYPNYEPIVRYVLLAMDNRESIMGIKSRNQVGVSREFHQLREYHEGDLLSQIDWKATSRRLSLISREYQEQRNQNIILLVDCGRRMRALDGDLSQFDHCLNAMLLLSYISLRQGDRVGVQGFGGSDRWLPPVKGQHSMPVILNHLYDYETTAAPSDFAEAAEKLMVRQSRRSLVVVLTNLRSEDSESIIAPLRFLQKRHLVMVASLRERDLFEKTQKPVGNFDEAVGLASTYRYFEERSRLFEKLRAQKIHLVDELATNLPIAITNEYLQIKKAGLL
jgi:uncharacterized protein (DUF58 family)